MNYRGVMVTAFERALHPDCFACSTCGNGLAQKGHHFLNDKFYCDVHGRQQQQQQQADSQRAGDM